MKRSNKTQVSIERRTLETEEGTQCNVRILSGLGRGKSNVIYILMRSQCWEREEKEAKVRGAEPGNQLRFIS